MTHPALAVHHWPDVRELQCLSPQAHPDLIVFGVTTPQTTLRQVARERIRMALRDVLGAVLGCAPEAVPLVSDPGHPVRVDLPGRRVGLSISHEPGLTIAAIHWQGAVGIDLMRSDNRPEAMQDWEIVAHEYLGKDACDRIATTSPALRAHAFAQEWTRYEACLKCHALPVMEWCPAVERSQDQCKLMELGLEQGLVGYVATFW